MVMQKYCFLTVFSFSLIPAVTYTEPKESFNTFIKSYVDQEHREGFISFYQTQLMELRHARQKNNGLLADQEQRRVQQLQKNGARFMQLKVPSGVAKEHQCKALCMRFGLYEEFLNNETKKNSSLMVRAQSYVRGMTYKITQLFGSVRNAFSRA